MLKYFSRHPGAMKEKARTVTKSKADVREWIAPSTITPERLTQVEAEFKRLPPRVQRFLKRLEQPLSFDPFGSLWAVQCVHNGKLYREEVADRNSFVAWREATAKLNGMLESPKRKH